MELRRETPSLVLVVVQCPRFGSALSRAWFQRANGDSVNCCRGPWLPPCVPPCTPLARRPNGRSEVAGRVASSQPMLVERATPFEPSGPVVREQSAGGGADECTAGGRSWGASDGPSVVRKGPFPVER